MPVSTSPVNNFGIRPPCSIPSGQSHQKTPPKEIRDKTDSMKYLENRISKLMKFKTTIEEKRSEIKMMMESLGQAWCDEDLTLYLTFILSTRRKALLLELRHQAQDAQNEAVVLFLNNCEYNDRPVESKPPGILPEVSKIILSKCESNGQLDETIPPGIPAEVSEIIRKQAKAFVKENNSLHKLLKEFNAEDEVDGFGNLKRFGETGKIAMHTVLGFEERIPKDSCLTMTELLQRMHINPDIHTPKYAVENVTWDSKAKQLVFDHSFDGVIPSVRATNHNLQYYNCHIAAESQILVPVLHESEIQLFDYTEEYLTDFIEKEGGGPGLERHPFPHMDCPNSEDSGHLVLAKFVDDNETKLHLTAFEVPMGETVYIPGNVIHTNDYFLGKWHTMLSGETDVDLVHLVKGNQKEAFHFSWPK